MKKQIKFIIAGASLLILGICTAFISGPEKTAGSKTKTTLVAKGIDGDCKFKGFKMYGKIQVVKSFPDLKVQIVNSFPDLKVQEVTSFPDACGKWQFVTSFPDLKIQYVESFPDIKIQFVKSFPGKP